MDAETAINELRQLFDDEIKFGDWKHHKKECDIRAEAILYAIESVRDRVVWEKEQNQ